MSNETNAAEYVGTALRGRLDDLAALHQLIDGDGDQADQKTVEGLGIGAEYDDHELQGVEGLGEEDAAQDALDSYPLCVERATVFEIVLGTGGPDDRLVIECSEDPYEIERIFYRYSWSGSAERQLSGDDYDTAERFARSVVPELTE
jgi:hypothetical protein